MVIPVCQANLYHESKKNLYRITRHGDKATANQVTGMKRHSTEVNKEVAARGSHSLCVNKQAGGDTNKNVLQPLESERSGFTDKCHPSFTCWIPSALLFSLSNANRASHTKTDLPINRATVDPHNNAKV